jgi:nucleotide-binding universal stress UspA family protein
MTEEQAMTEIVVGVDGSASSRQALRWAAHEADRQGSDLVVLQSWHDPSFGGPGLSAGYEVDLVVEDAKSALQSIVATVHHSHPAVHVSSVLAEARPARALIDRASVADLLVVGSRGSGGFFGLELGSVSTKVARRSTVPVVVVRGDHDRSAKHEVVVGVDGSACSRDALRWAAAWAKEQDKTLTVVLAWSFLEPQDPSGPGRIRPEYGERDAMAALDAIVADVLGPRPNPRIVTEVVCDLPARAVLERADDACLIVVGRHGTARWAPPALGSTAVQILHHAPCPVAVIPGEGRQGDATG